MECDELKNSITIKVEPMSVSIFSCTPAAPAKRRSAKKGGAESAKKAGAKAGFAETDPAKLTAAASEAQAQAETAVKPEKKRASVLDQVAEKLPATASTITNFKDAVAKHTGRGKKQTEGK